MSKNPWMPFYVRDYIGDTMPLSLVEHGAYIKLLCYYWINGSLPSDLKQLLQICSAFASSEIEAVESICRRYFVADGNCLINKRIEEEIVKARNKSEKRIELGRLGGIATQAKAKAKAQARVDSDTDSDSDSEVKEGKKKKDIVGQARPWIDILNQTTGQSYRYGDANLKHVKARINDGFTEDDCRKVCESKAAEWKGTDMEKFLRPETLFGSKFDSYLQASKTSTSGDPDPFARILGK